MFVINSFMDNFSNFNMNSFCSNNNLFSNCFMPNIFQFNNTFFDFGVGSFNYPSYGSVSGKTKSSKALSNLGGNYSYDLATVDKLLKKYNVALNKVGDKKAFVQKAVGIAQKYHIDPDALLVIFYSESGINPKSAGGIFGCIASTASRYGTSLPVIRNMNATQQLDLYERILKDQIKMCFGKNPPNKISGAILYAMNFTPAYVKDAIKDPNHVLVSANSSDSKKRACYYANDGKGSLANGTDHISFDTINVRLGRKEREMQGLRYYA